MKTPTYIFRAVLGAAIFSAVLAPVAVADDPPYRVARLSYASGSVSLQPAGVDDWTAASINRPLTTGDRLYTDDGARAELHIGSAVLRLNGQTSMSFLNLDDYNTQIQLNEGSLNIRVRTLGDQDTFEVDTPNLAFTVLRPGEYRVDADADGASTLITVRSGDGEATGGGQAFTVHASQQARVSGTGDLTYELNDAPQPDGFDDWSVSRDAREDRALSPRYVSRDMIGYEDLDDYGSWTDISGYGPVWTPVGLAPGWAPYRYGHWAWIAPWGWTWVDDTSWGFCPFHYGRWAFVGNGWVWVPGPLMVRPVYSPALVVFVGGPRFGTALSFGGGGGVGWFPLAPGEPYVPGYRASPAYIGRVNNTTINNTTVNNITVNNYHYANRGVPGAVTAVPTQTFANARPVAASAVRVSPAAAQAGQAGPAATVAPVKTSVLGPAAGGPSVPHPPAAVVSRQVVAKTPPPPPPVPFARQQQALAAQPGRPLESEALTKIQPPAPARPLVKIAPPATPSATKPPAPPSNVQPSGVKPTTPNKPVSPNNQPPATNAPPSTRPPSATQPPTVPPKPPSETKPPAAPPKPPSEPRPLAPAPKPPSEPRPPAPAPQPPSAPQPSGPAPTPPPTPRPAQPPKEQKKEKTKPAEPKPPIA